MTAQRGSTEDSRIRSALDELEGMIARHYPQATFQVSEGEDPEGIYLTVTVDLEDSTEVMGVFIDRLVDMQVEEGLPVYVVVVRPLERVLEEMRASRRPNRPLIDLDALIPPIQL